MGEPKRVQLKRVGVHRIGRSMTNQQAEQLVELCNVNNLDLNERVGIVQSAIAEWGPVPDDYGNAVRELMTDG